MYNLISTIAERCHASATKRGKDTSSLDVMLLSGAVQFVCGCITGPADVERLQIVANLKMRYNELRED